METTNPETPSNEPKYQVKAKKDENLEKENIEVKEAKEAKEPEKKTQANQKKKGNGKGNNQENKKDDSKKLITINSIKLADFNSWDKAAEAISNSLLTYKVASPDKIKSTVINYFKKQCVAGLKMREKILKDGGETTNILTQSVLECQDLTGSKDKKPDVFDYCIYFVYKMVEAMLKNKNLLLNKQSLNYLRVYYDIIESIFTLDNVVSRAKKSDSTKEEKKESTQGEDAETKEDPQPEVKDEDAGADEEEEDEVNDGSKDSVFGNGPKLTGYQDLQEKHFTWIYKILEPLKVFQSEALKFHVQMANGVDAKNDIIKSVESIFQDKNGNQVYGCHLVEKYNLYDGIDLLKTCEKLAEINKLETILKLIGKHSKVANDIKNPMQRQLIDNLLKANFNKYGKICDEIVQKIPIPYEDYPVLVERKKRNSVFHFANNFLGKKEDDKDFMGLDRVESIYSGQKECLAHLCDIVYNSGRKMMAKGIFMRNKLKADDFSKITAGTGKSKIAVGKELEELKYEESQDYEPLKDMFEPISLPSKDFIRFPLNIKIEFIDTEKKISELEDLKGQKYIGVDAEWRPQPHRWYESKGPAVFQIAGKNEAFIIDMIKLGKSAKLNNMLKSIFTHKNTSVVGFAFSSDISQFHKYCPSMNFIDNMPKHIDLHKVFSKLHPQSKSTGLATCAETTLEKKLCKKEQMSNWEMRPLRFSQEHYAAMDAWILVQLVEKLQEKSKKQKVDFNQFIENIVDGVKSIQKNDVKKVSDKDKSKSKEKEKEKVQNSEKDANKQKAGKRDRNNQKQLTVPENQVANPNKLEDYEKNLEYHIKMVDHFTQLIAKAKEMKETQKTEEDKKEPEKVLEQKK